MPVVPCPDCERDVSTLAPACPHCGRPSPAGTAVPSEPRLPATEETLWRGTPSAIVLLGHFLGVLATLILVPLAARLVTASIADIEQASRLTRNAWFLVAALLAIQVLFLAVAWLRLRSTLYTVTNQRVMIETGLIAKAVNEIDLRYVNDSQFTQGVMQRILGIGNVTLVSTDKTTPVFVLRAIRDPRGVREIIRSHAYQVSQRQILTRAT